MSYSIVKKSLQLMEEELLQQMSDPSGSSKKRKTKDAMKLIKTNRKGVWKELRKLQKLEQQKIKSKLAKPNFKSAVEKFQDDKRKAENAKLKFHQDSSAEPRNNENSKKVLQYHMQQFNRRKVEEPKKQERTVFTDRDFDKFEEEYDFWD